MNRITVLTVLLLASLLVGVIYVAWHGSSQAVVLVEWETASELETAGFNLYRSLDPDGPFGPVNSALIPTAGDPLVGGKYSYEDTSVEPGSTFYYQLEELRLDGSSERFGPISVKAEGSVPPLAVPALIASILVLFLVLIWLLVFRKSRTEKAPQSSGAESG